MAVPKVLDFGLAKATGDDSIAQTLLTRHDVVMGTPEYMAPEQATAGSDQVIDTRADIYSLGVILYELLSGDLPFDGEALRAGGWAGIQRVLQEQEPPKPSAKATTIGADEGAAARAKARGVRGSVLARELRGDLDWIVMMAMAKEPDRRYQTADALAEGPAPLPRSRARIGGTAERHLPDQEAGPALPRAAVGGRGGVDDVGRRRGRRHRVRGDG